MGRILYLIGTKDRILASSRNSFHQTIITLPLPLSLSLCRPPLAGGSLFRTPITETVFNLNVTGSHFAKMKGRSKIRGTVVHFPGAPWAGIFC